MKKSELKMLVLKMSLNYQAMAKEKGIEQPMNKVEGRASLINFNLQYYFNQPQSNRFTKAELTKAAETFLAAAKQLG